MSNRYNLTWFGNMWYSQGLCIIYLIFFISFIIYRCKTITECYTLSNDLDCSYDDNLCIKQYNQTCTLRYLTNDELYIFNYFHITIFFSFFIIFFIILLGVLLYNTYIWKVVFRNQGKYIPAHKALWYSFSSSCYDPKTRCEKHGLDWRLV